MGILCVVRIGEESFLLHRDSVLDPLFLDRVSVAGVESHFHPRPQGKSDRNAERDEFCVSMLVKYGQQSAPWQQDDQESDP